MQFEVSSSQIKQGMARVTRLDRRKDGRMAALARASNIIAPDR